MINNTTRLEYLDAMGIDVWVTNEGGHHLSAQLFEGEFAVQQPGNGISCSINGSTDDLTPEIPSTEVGSMDQEQEWKTLKDKVAACKACELHQSRTQTVFGSGSHTANWMIIGEAPGANEDLQGIPFVGRAGSLLNEMLRAVGLQREDVFIANILKCRPPRNRDPKPMESESCEPFLKAQIKLLKPEIILAVGRVAAQNLLKTDTPVGKLRNKVHSYQGIPVVVLYHPAYLLRSPLEKRKAWDDLLLASKVFNERNK